MAGAFDCEVRKAFNYYFKDHLGNIRVTVDEDGEVVTADDYYPFGMIMPGRSYNVAFSGNQYKFGSKEWDDENNLNWYHFDARRYDPEIARFNTIDPLTNIYPWLSPYVYVANNPLRFMDPTGMSILDPKYYLNGVEIQGELIDQVSEVAEKEKKENDKKEEKQKANEKVGKNISPKDPADEFDGEPNAIFKFKAILYALYNTLMGTEFTTTPKPGVSIVGQKPGTMALPGTPGEIYFDDEKVGFSFYGVGMNIYNNGDIGYSGDLPLVNVATDALKVSGNLSFEYRFFKGLYDKEFQDNVAEYYRSYFESIYGD